MQHAQYINNRLCYMIFIFIYWIICCYLIQYVYTSSKLDVLCWFLQIQKIRIELLRNEDLYQKYWKCNSIFAFESLQRSNHVIMTFYRQTNVYEEIRDAMYAMIVLHNLILHFVTVTISIFLHLNAFFPLSRLLEVINPDTKNS